MCSSEKLNAWKVPFLCIRRFELTHSVNLYMDHTSQRGYTIWFYQYELFWRTRYGCNEYLIAALNMKDGATQCFAAAFYWGFVRTLCRLTYRYFAQNVTGFILVRIVFCTKAVHTRFCSALVKYFDVALRWPVTRQSNYVWSIRIFWFSYNFMDFLSIIS